MLKEVAKVLNRFGKKVVTEAKKNAIKKSSTGKLANSIDYKLNNNGVDFIMEEYGMFIDKGIKGANPKLVGGIQKGIGAKHTFKGKMPPMKSILAWVKRKGLKMRDKKTGKFARGNQRSLAFLIQRSIYAQGIKPSLFFTTPFRKYFVRLDDELADALGEEILNPIREIKKNSNNIS